MNETMRERRERLGLTRLDMAKACGLSLNYYYELEMGIKKNPTLEVMQRVAKCLETTPGAIADMVTRGIAQDEYTAGASVSAAASLYLDTLAKGLREKILLVRRLEDGVEDEEAIGYYDDRYFYLDAHRAYAGVCAMLLDRGVTYPESLRHTNRILREAGVVERDAERPLAVTRPIEVGRRTMRLLWIRRERIEAQQKDRYAAV